MSEQDATFKTHALVELFGHARIAGLVSEQTIAGQGFVRVDVPATANGPAYTRLFGPSAIYSMTPVTEDVALAIAATIRTPDIVPISAPTRRLTDTGDERYVVQRYDDGEEE
jgi:hypothetical protein